MHPDQPDRNTVKRKAEKSLVIAVADALDAGVTPAEVQSAIAEGIDVHTSDMKQSLRRKILSDND